MIGKRISGRYQILSRLGDGGMAIVYKAQDLILDRLVAVKILRSEFSNDDDFIRRFRREAESVASLSHPNIVSIYDIGEEDDCYFIVMEYVDGVTLKKFIQDTEPVPFEDTVYILKQIALAIGHAHERGIVHRDIKPHNILIDHHDNVKVTDFGIALAVTSATITYTNAILGSAHYLSPEQAKGGKATIKSDIYALGIVMFELLTGRLPFPGSSPVTVALKHLNEPVPFPSEFRQDLPQSLENIVIKSMSKNPEYRYDNINAFYNDLDTALDPSRRHEPRLILPVDEDDDNDGENTKIIPIVGSGLAGDNTDDGESAKTTKDNGATALLNKKDKKEKKKMKKGKKLFWIIFILILLLGGASATAFYVIPKIFYVNNVTVPDVTGKSYDDATDILKEHHLYVDRKERPDKDVKENDVIKQDPKGKTNVKENATITLYVSTGPEKVKVDDYVGYDKDTVKSLLDGNDYKKVVYREETSSDVAPGEIMKQKPDAGSEVVPSETVLELTYSAGPPKSTVPDLTGMTKDEAESALKDVGLNADFKEGDYSDDVEKDHVLKQSPANGDTVQQGSSVTVYLSKGKKLKPKEVTKSITVKVDNQRQEPPGNDRGKGHGRMKGPDRQPSPVHVQIVYSDASHDHDTFVEEDITETKTYDLKMTINPKESAHYKVIVDGQTQQEETVNYDQS
ncbi:serine/threonine-protein kinase [Scopulibacillus darangshiensis]|uniref:Serine/threonine-protein kinase PrkC n=1 Tax=Scopulibacillus darangshiensis TaxID=442528 RepID=A0A4R2P393_9BACL|nr:Stk1 family PASTA domain-containing Ser/Thr kinase [Scopulibacillus darangshiensis]TCP29132.1 serine/threonine-protein kinase [Scopulibacillus darangshiensis]